MSWINSWANSLVASVIVVTILELILPDSKNKKYIKTVMGLYLLFTIIGPVITKFTNNSLDIKSVTGYENIIMQSNKNVKALDLNTKQNVNLLYQENITNMIKEELEAKGYIVSAIEIDIDNNNYENINSIQLNISKKSINKIEEINISTKKNSIDNSIKAEITEILYLNYNIPKENIKINE